MDSIFYYQWSWTVLRYAFFNINCILQGSCPFHLNCHPLWQYLCYMYRICNNIFSCISDLGYFCIPSFFLNILARALSILSVFFKGPPFGFNIFLHCFLFDFCSYLDYLFTLLTLDLICSSFSRFLRYKHRSLILKQSLFLKQILRRVFFPSNYVSAVSRYFHPFFFSSSSVSPLLLRLPFETVSWHNFISQGKWTLLSISNIYIFLW